MDNKHYICRNGVQIPLLGLGTWRAEKKEAQTAVLKALQLGYRLIDTASFYDNEKEVGDAIAASDVGRDELFVTSKVWIDDSGYDDTLRAFEKSLKELGLDYLDMYMVHWPVRGKYKETYRAIETLYQQKRIRVVGVCNFSARLLKEMTMEMEIAPMVNQLQFHPRYIRKEELYYAKDEGILLQAWKPLARGLLSQDAKIMHMAKTYEKSAEQILLRWAVQLGLCVIPKTVRADRLLENAAIFDFELTQNEMDYLWSLDKGENLSSLPESAVQS